MILYFNSQTQLCLGVNNIDQFKRDLERTEDETKCSIGSCLYYGEKVEDFPSSAVWAHANTRVGVSPTDNQNMKCLVCEETVPTNNAVISEEHGQRLGFQIHEVCKDELIDILETAWENNHEEILAEQTR